jgi:membrane-associated phospholipid phosphatase
LHVLRGWGQAKCVWVYGTMTRRGFDAYLISLAQFGSRAKLLAIARWAWGYRCPICAAIRDVMIIAILVLLTLMSIGLGRLFTPVDGAAVSRVGAVIAAPVDRATGVLAASLRRWLGSDLAEIPGLVVLGLVVILGGWAFLELLEHVVMGDAIVGVDARVFSWLAALRTPAFDGILIAVTEIGDANVSMPVFGAALVALVLLRQWRATLFLAAGYLGAALFVGGLKGVIARPRPVSIYDGVIDYSFPSGHACMSIVLYAILAVLLTRGASLSWRRSVATATILFVVLVSFSRVYLGAHWMSDVLAGLAFGAAWVAGLTIIYLRHETPPLPTQVLIPGLVAVLVLASAVHIARDFAGEAVRYSHGLAKPL